MTVMRIHGAGAGLFAVGLVTFTSALLLGQTPAPPAAPPAPPAPQTAAPPAPPAPQTAAPAPPAAAGPEAAKAATTPETPATPPPGTIIGEPVNDPVKGAALLDEARKALGGADKFKAIQRLEVKGKVARVMQQTLEGDFEIALELPDNFRRKESLGVSDFHISILQRRQGDDATQKVDMEQSGGGNWEESNRSGNNRSGNNNWSRGRGNDIARLLGATGDDPEQQRLAVTTEQARFMMLWLLTTSEPVAWIGKAEARDGYADVLEFKTPDGVATKLLLAEKTHLPLMITWPGLVQNFSFNNRNSGNRGSGNSGGRGRSGNSAQPGNLQIYLSDYKTVQGIKFPHLIQSGGNNETTEELVVKSVKINPIFKADIFTK